MFTFFAITAVIVVLWATASRIFLKEGICSKEAIIKACATIAVSGAFLMIMFFSNVSDVNILNGQITGKEQVRVSCSHAYPCNCRTVCTSTGNSQSCSTVCDTCYMHPYDYDWRVRSTVGSFNIDRIDMQGTRTPPRWSAVEIGEPASREQTYRNWIKGAPNSLYNFSNMDLGELTQSVPAYPRPHDYYRFNRVVSAGATISSSRQLNDHLNNALRTLGPSKEVNIIVVTTNIDNPNYKFALEQNWIGGKKNDVVVVISVNAAEEVQWSDSFTIGNTIGNEMLAVVLRDDIRNLGNVKDAEALGRIIISAVTTHFTRKEMSDFEYLRKEYTPPLWLTIVYAITILVVLTGLTFFMYFNSLFGTGVRFRGFRRNRFRY